MSGTESDSDEDLRRAIALSLEEIDDPDAKSAAKSVGGEPEIIDLLSSDEDNDDLDRPTVQKRKINSMSSKSKSTTDSLVDEATQPHQGKPPDLHPERVSPVIINTSSGMSGNVSSNSLFSGLNRRAMEAERLARAKKRKASTSPPSTRNENGRYVRARISTSPNRKRICLYHCRYVISVSRSFPCRFCFDRVPFLPSPELTPLDLKTSIKSRISSRGV